MVGRIEVITGCMFSGKSTELLRRLHDEDNKFKEGEKVSIIECKPISKKKTWQVIK